MNDSMVPLLNEQSLSGDYTSDVAFDINETTAYLTYSNGILKLFNPENKNVYDRINPKDIIGVELEISLDGHIPNKALKGREKMERIENHIRSERLAAGESNDEHHLSNDESLITSKAMLNIYAYPKAISNGFISKIKSCLQTNDSQEEQGEEGSQPWYGNRYEKHRRFLLKPVEDLSSARSLVSFIRKVAKLEQKDNLRYLIMVNPFSGTKRGIETYHNVVKKLLNERGIDNDVLVTRKAGHAMERVMENYELKEGERDLQDYDGIVVLGGDGLLSEVLQGLRTRNDYDDIMKRLKFGIVGCGEFHLTVVLSIF
jgi:hypothetical protein